MRDFAELQRRFVETTEFGAFWNDFLDDWAMQPWFMNLGIPAKFPEMEILVADIVGKMYGRIVQPKEMRLVQIASARLVHGVFRVERGLGGVLYFERIEKGLIVAPGVGIQVHYARFTRQFNVGSHFDDIPRDPRGSGLPN